MGSKKDKVEYRIDNGAWEEMDYDETVDPNFALSVFKWDSTQNLFPGRRPSNPEMSKHIWTAGFPKKLALGKHKLEVKAADMYGNQFTVSEEFEVQNPVLIP
jgi:hypothetical protein